VAGNLVLLWLAAFPLMSNPGAATLSLAVMGAAFGARRGVLVGTFFISSLPRPRCSTRTWVA